MKHLALYIRYISLLLFGGLTIPFYSGTLLHIKDAEQHLSKKIQVITAQPDPEQAPFSFFNDVVVIFFPVLKN